MGRDLSEVSPRLMVRQALRVVGDVAKGAALDVASSILCEAVIRSPRLRELFMGKYVTRWLASRTLGDWPEPGPSLRVEQPKSAPIDGSCNNPWCKTCNPPLTTRSRGLC